MIFKKMTQWFSLMRKKIVNEGVCTCVREIRLKALGGRLKCLVLVSLDWFLSKGVDGI